CRKRHLILDAGIVCRQRQAFIKRLRRRNCGSQSVLAAKSKDENDRVAPPVQQLQCPAAMHSGEQAATDQASSISSHPPYIARRRWPPGQGCKARGCLRALPRGGLEGTTIR